MRLFILFLLFIFCPFAAAMPQFVPSEPIADTQVQVNAQALCNTAKETIAYINNGKAFDPLVIHDGKVFKLPLAQIKKTLEFICQHQNQLNDANFIRQHFAFYRWYPSADKDKIRMTKYYVHRAQVAAQTSSEYPFALYALPMDEQGLSVELANGNPNLTRFHYTKQAILQGALKNKSVPVLAYLKREDLEEALMQGTIVADFANSRQIKIFNVDRNNNVAYDRYKQPYQQGRYWYFKQVNGIKGYGKDAEHKITINPEVTFAGDLEQLGLGKLLMVQYKDRSSRIISRMGILADTGGAFKDNLYQVDYLIGSYEGKKEFYKASSAYPDYVLAYFMVLKN